MQIIFDQRETNCQNKEKSTSWIEVLFLVLDVVDLGLKLVLGRAG